MSLAEKRKYEFYLSVLKEIAKEYRANTNIDTIIKNIETQIKELKNN